MPGQNTSWLADDLELRRFEHRSTGTLPVSLVSVAVWAVAGLGRGWFGPWQVWAVAGARQRSCTVCKAPLAQAAEPNLQRVPNLPRWWWRGAYVELCRVTVPLVQGVVGLDMEELDPAELARMPPEPRRPTRQHLGNSICPCLGRGGPRLWAGQPGCLGGGSPAQTRWAGQQTCHRNPDVRPDPTPSCLDQPTFPTSGLDGGMPGCRGLDGGRRTSCGVTCRHSRAI